MKLNTCKSVSQRCVLVTMSFKMPAVVLTVIHYEKYCIMLELKNFVKIEFRNNICICKSITSRACVPTNNSENVRLILFDLSNTLWFAYYLICLPPSIKIQGLLAGLFGKDTTTANKSRPSKLSPYFSI